MLEFQAFSGKNWLWFKCYIVVSLVSVPLCHGQGNDLANTEESPVELRKTKRKNPNTFSNSSSQSDSELARHAGNPDFPEDISGIWENTTEVPAYDFNGHVRRESTFKLTLKQEQSSVKGTFLMRVFMSGGTVQKHTHVKGTYKAGFLTLKTVGIIKEGCYTPANVSGLYDLNFSGKITNNNGVLILDGQYDFASQKSFQSLGDSLIFTTAILGLKGPVKIYAKRIAPLKPEPKKTIRPDTVQAFNQSDSIFNNILFKQGEADLLTRKDSLELVRLGDMLQAYPTWKVKLDGYTENRGRLRENIVLSEKRSEFLKNYLVQQKSISGERIITAGFGPYNPVADNRNERKRQLNRRVEIQIYIE
ncbi:OmpA family protein [Fulvivirgaceae bacterium BMA12]|uniref:OmpA family protein n=1 Tax=Agaribacillus aureus TaxID=3051825 RepID=A0ABT8L7N0_9BACT|nr:OmpA family protein [Fulvivirgaceae bacterium BMA12]